MSFKNVALIILVAFCFLLVLATVAQAFQEAADSGTADLDQYRAVVGIKATATNYPTSTAVPSTKVPAENSATETPSGMYESD